MNAMRNLRRFARGVDLAFEYVGLVFLAAMSIIVFWQVFSRYVLDYTPNWSQEVSMIFMIWVAFIGIALGFREGLHVAVRIIVRRFPPPVQWAVRLAILVLAFLFGLYLLVEGWNFTILANLSTLPGTGLPSGVFYACMPLAGAAICVYSLLQLAGVRTERDERLADDELDVD